jgi:hypothetical protein
LDPIHKVELIDASTKQALLHTVAGLVQLVLVGMNVLTMLLALAMMVMGVTLLRVGKGTNSSFVSDTSVILLVAADCTLLFLCFVGISGA